MALIIFKRENQKKRELKQLIEIEWDKPYSLYTGIQKIYTNHNHAQNKNLILTITPTFCEKEEDDSIREVFEDEIPLGFDEPLNVFEYLRSRILKIFHNQDSEEKDYLLNFLEEIEIQYEYAENKNYTQKEHEKLMQSAIEKKESRQEQPLSQPQDSQIDMPSRADTQSEVAKKNKDKPKEKIVQPVKKNTKSKFKKAIPALVTIILVLTGFGYNSYRSYAESNVPLEERIEQEEYDKALEYYPEEVARIEREMFLKGHDYLDELKELNNQYDYPQTEFDIAFLENDFQKVIELSDLADSEGRQAQLVIAYLGQGYNKEAYILNDILESDELDLAVNSALLAEGKQALANNDVQYAKEIAENTQNDNFSTIISDYETLNKEISEYDKKLEEEEDKKKVEKLIEERDRLKEDLEELKNNLLSDTTETTQSNSKA